MRSTKSPTRHLYNIRADGHATRSTGFPGRRSSLSLPENAHARHERGARQSRRPIGRIFALRRQSTAEVSRFDFDAAMQTPFQSVGAIPIMRTMVGSSCDNVASALNKLEKELSKAPRYRTPRHGTGSSAAAVRGVPTASGAPFFWSLRLRALSAKMVRMTRRPSRGAFRLLTP